MTPAAAAPICATIGNFDGVHCGHQSLIRLTLERAAAEGLAPALITFWPHPREILRGKGAHRPLASRSRRLELLRAAGLGRIIEIPFTPELAALDAETFLRRHLLPLNMAELVIGHDFCLGRQRSGNAGRLWQLAGQYGFRLSQAGQFQVNGAPASSTRIREALVAGDARAAAALLGRPHRVCGKVGHGDGRGAGLGFPTANLVGADCILPGNGVYASIAHCGGKEYNALTNIGFNPTFAGKGLRVESFLLDANADFYDREICLDFLEKLRGERKFASAAELSAQIAADVRRARAIFAGGGVK